MTRVKVCGLRRLEDAMLAVELGADALGFVFWPSSPRFVEPDAARQIVAALPPFVATVGVFVDQPPAFVSDVARTVGLTAVQLHGDEQIDAFTHLPQQLIKAIGVAAGDNVEARIAALPKTVGVLLDAHDPVKRGGTGRTIDWHRAAAIAAGRQVILSGGLNAGNISAAIATVKPYAVDVSSGVESSPGVKDAARLRAFFESVAETHTTTNPEPREL